MSYPQFKINHKYSVHFHPNNAINSLDTFDPVVNSSSFPEPGYIIFLLIFGFSSPILPERPFVKIYLKVVKRAHGTGGYVMLQHHSSNTE